jgi:hypothetical protein
LQIKPFISITGVKGAGTVAVLALGVLCAACTDRPMVAGTTSPAEMQAFAVQTAAWQAQHPAIQPPIQVAAAPAPAPAASVVVAQTPPVMVPDVMIGAVLPPAPVVVEELGPIAAR